MTGRSLRVLAVLGLAVVALWLSMRTPTHSRQAPKFVLPDLSGKAVRMDDLRGKVVLLNLWATWCPPCVEEMPTLEVLSKKMTGRDFVLLAIAEDDQPENVGPWIEKRGLTFPVLLDAQGKVGADLGITGYPETFIVDRTGRIVYHHIGYRDWAEPGMIAALERLMNTGDWRLG
jgi:cytochrome c biogenesis protein CcmG/thiol:disulfide interchange protein DsbE